MSRSNRVYPWVIAFTAMFILFVTNGLLIGGLSVFDESLLNAFDWSRGELKFRDLLTLGLAGLLGPVAGTLADRIGMRRLMLFGASLLVVGMFLYGRIQSALHMYLLHVVFALVIVTCGLIVAVMLVSRWFYAKRGTAVGIALVGTSLGGVILPKVGAALIQSFGWRTGFQLEAVLPIVLILVILLLVKDSPAAAGMKPLGLEAGSEQVAVNSKPKLSGLGYKEALSTSTFWALALTAMMTFYSILGVSSHLFLHLRGWDFEIQKAASGISLLFTFGLVGKFLFGFLSDIFNHKLVFLTNLTVMLLGSICLSSMDPSLFWPFLILFGVGWGGLYTMLQLLCVESFGLRSSGKILGTITLMDAVGGGLGPFITGVLFDRTGSYRASFIVVSVLIFLSLLAGTVVRKRFHEEQTA